MCLMWHWDVQGKNPSSVILLSIFSFSMFRLSLLTCPSDLRASKKKDRERAREIIRKQRILGWVFFLECFVKTRYITERVIRTCSIWTSFWLHIKSRSLIEYIRCFTYVMWSMIAILDFLVFSWALRRISQLFPIPPTHIKKNLCSKQ